MKIFITILLVIVVGFILNYGGLLRWLNQPINELVSGIPNTQCTTDEDCIIRPVQCQTECGCSDEVAVNREWLRYCPFKKSIGRILCGPCGPSAEVGCVKGQCRIL